MPFHVSPALGGFRIAQVLSAHPASTYIHFIDLIGGFGMTYSLRVLMIPMIVGFGFLSFGSFAVAEEDTIKAVAPWKGDVHAFPIGNDRVYMVAVYSGTIFVDKGEGVLHAASIVCPATVEMNLTTGKKSGQGHCVITNSDGDRIYADYTCTGDLKGCTGPFTLVGGTGKFTGITGEGEMFSQLTARAVLVVEGFESARQHGQGIAVWPKLTYRIPGTQ